ncbi:MAG: hypothetical protein HQM08_06745 [Candidatus Riflebacteria bacterium]|nr:hypothetical protein [Candidatus Riflebacteria bacterium]
MGELFRLFSDIDNVQIVTMILIGLLCLLWIYWIYKNSALSGLELTPMQWWHIYFLGAICFFSGVWTLGLLTFPENAKNLMELLCLKPPIDWLTKHVQQTLLSIIRALS